MFRKKPPVMTAPHEKRKKYAAVTTETAFAIRSFPKDARQMLEAILPVFDAVHATPASPDRWLTMLINLPDEVLVQLPRLKETKVQQASHVVVMLCVFARALLHPTDTTGLRCEMTDNEVHLASNRIFLYYFPMELYRRRGYLQVDFPPDPFAEWSTLRFSYTAAGIAAKNELGEYTPADTTTAGQLVEVSAAEMGLS